MYVYKETPEELVIKSKPDRVGSLLLSVGFISALFAVLVAVFGSGNSMTSYGLGGISIFILLAYLSFYEQVLFVFDREAKFVKWHRTRFLHRKEGGIPFNEIKDVVLERPKVDYSYNMSRIVLVTSEEKIPLTGSYLKHSNNTVEILNKVRDVLQLPRLSGYRA